MTISIAGLLVLVMIAGICGAIGRVIGGGTGGGFLVSIVIGFIGALLGSLVAYSLHLPDLLLLQVYGKTFPVLWSIIGASLFVALIQLFSGGMAGRWRYR
jgi:uncharacterized membrane protein YeaQ/YmgE (transglycosylase-associated protein family)